MVTMIRALAGEPSTPSGFPILLDRNMAIIAPAFARFLENAALSGRAQASETVRTYGEHLHDWFDALEQSGIEWREADESVIAACRNRMPENHIHRAMIDRAYVDTYFELGELIDDEAADEACKALEDLLLTPRVAGKAGVMLSERSPFRGRTRSGDVDAHNTQILVGTDMRLGVCDWGYCLYRRETYACLCGERDPNPVLRTQSTCSTCANFAVTGKHRPVWKARLQRNTAWIGRDDLDPASRMLAETHIEECQNILDKLDEGHDDGTRD